MIKRKSCIAMLVLKIIKVIGFSSHTNLNVFPGFILKIDAFNELRTEDLYEDELYWLMEEGEEEDNHVASITSGDSGIPMHHTAQVGANGK